MGKDCALCEGERVANKWLHIIAAEIQRSVEQETDAK